MAGGDGHFMLRQDYRALEGIMVAEGQSENNRGFRVRQPWCLVLALSLAGPVT